MKQDLIRLTVVSLSLGVIVWAIYGNPESRAHTALSVRADPQNLKLVSEESPYLRTER
jgi:hypothetical protein